MNGKIKISGWAYCFYGNKKGKIGIVNGSIFYPAKALNRTDVKKHFSLESVYDNVKFGFISMYDAGAEVAVCIVDEENKLLYLKNAIKNNEPIDVSDYTTVFGNLNYYIDEERISDSGTQISGWAYCHDGFLSGKTGIVIGNIFYPANCVSRPDVKAHFSLDTVPEESLLGFVINCNTTEEAEVCIIDCENKIVYRK